MKATATTPSPIAVDEEPPVGGSFLSYKSIALLLHDPRSMPTTGRIPKSDKRVEFTPTLSSIDSQHPTVPNGNAWDTETGSFSLSSA